MIEAGSKNVSSVRRESRIVNRVSMTFERKQARGGGAAPDSCRTIKARSYDSLPIGGELCSRDLIRVPHEGCQQAAIGAIPQPRRIIFTRRHDAFAVRREARSVDDIRVALKNA